MRGVPDALVISRLIFRRDVAGNVMVPAPDPVFRTAPVSLFTTRHVPMVPLPGAVRTTTAETVCAVPHLTERRPVEPLGDQYVDASPSIAFP